ncbi:MAG: hypothetical protein NWE89_05235 [Candidatus Bathyarchaeota archaeon]|nr:hypothetical protein [Candidatus Bathyarchaeota archaeon]
MRIGLWQRLKIRLGLAAYVGHRQKPGWRGPLSFYAFRCSKHGLVEGYKHGYEGRLECPKYRLEETYDICPSQGGRGLTDIKKRTGMPINLTRTILARALKDASALVLMAAYEVTQRTLSAWTRISWRR